MNAKRVMRPLVILLVLLLGREAQAFYNPSTGRWLSRDPVGEKGGRNVYGFVENNGVSSLDGLGLMGQKGRLEPVRGRPDTYRFVPTEPAYQLARCSITIIVGHTSIMPGGMTVKRKDKGCAYGEIYGCATGGGSLESDVNGRSATILIPEFKTPGIPGAPSKPTTEVEDDALIDLATRAFAAAKTAALTMCKKCCCKAVSISTMVVVSEEELTRHRPQDEAMLNLENNETIVACP
jgi:hypothetical protein